MQQDSLVSAAASPAESDGRSTHRAAVAAAARGRLADLKAAGDADVRDVLTASAAREAKRADLHAQQSQVSGCVRCTVDCLTCCVTVMAMLRHASALMRRQLALTRTVPARA